MLEGTSQPIAASMWKSGKSRQTAAGKLWPTFLTPTSRPRRQRKHPRLRKRKAAIIARGRELTEARDPPARNKSQFVAFPDRRGKAERRSFRMKRKFLWTVAFATLAS